MRSKVKISKGAQESIDGWGLDREERISLLLHLLSDLPANQSEWTTVQFPAKLHLYRFRFQGYLLVASFEIFDDTIHILSVVRHDIDIN